MDFVTEGFHHVTMVSRDAQRTVSFYRDLLGLRLIKKTVNFDLPTTYLTGRAVLIGTAALTALTWLIMLITWI